MNIIEQAYTCHLNCTLNSFSIYTIILCSTLTMQQISSKELGKVCIQLKKKQFVNKQFLTNKTNQLLSKQMKPKRNSIAIQDRRLFKSYIHL